MLNFITGRAGTGKTTLIRQKIAEIIETTEQNITVIVPEQQTVAWETALAELLPPSANLRMEITNFTRLSNSVFREYGGLADSLVDEGVRALLIWRAMVSVWDQMTVYNNADGREDRNISTLMQAVDELKNSGISPEDAEKALDALEHTGNSDPAPAKTTANVRRGGLKARLRDAVLVYSAYNAILHEEYIDRGDLLHKLGDKLEKHPYFRGKAVFIDSFFSLTQAEERILGLIFRQTDDVWISFACPDGKDSADEIQFGEVRAFLKTAQRLAARADRDVNFIRLTENLRHADNPALAAVERHLFNYSDEIAPVPQNEEGTVRIIRCTDRYDEAELCAALIDRLLRQGYRYSEIAVAARNIKSREGIVDAALRRHGIRCFMAESSQVSASPAVRLIYSALMVGAGNWQRRDVIRLLKTGMTPASLDDSDDMAAEVLELYTKTWNIRGRKAYNREWRMNPSGYKMEMTERDRTMLRLANRAREAMIPPLEAFLSLFDDEKGKSGMADVRKICEGAVHFAEACRVNESLKRRAQAYREIGMPADADKTARSWNLVCEILDKIVLALDGTSLDCGKFAGLFMRVAQSMDVNSIPTGIDEVVLGSSSGVRYDAVRCVILLGSVSGEFPGTVSDEMFFDDSDRAALESVGVVLGSPDRLTKTAREYFMYYRTAASAGEKLYILCPMETGEMSEGAARVEKILPGCLSDYAKMPLKDVVFHRSAAEYLLSRRTDPGERRILERVLGGDGAEGSEIPLTAETDRIAPEKTGWVSADVRRVRMPMTQSRIESFVMCPFNYSCRYLMKLQPEVRAEITAPDIGTFIHSILERFFGETDPSEMEDPTQLEKSVDGFIGEYLRELGRNSDPDGSKNALDGRLTYLFLRLRRHVMVFVQALAEEMRQSQFRPAAFELPVGMDGGTVISLDEDTDVLLRGVVDRVDLYDAADGKKYVRIVDYKTGSKSFSMEDIRRGIGVQLLIYLFSVWKSGLPGVKSDDLQPAGAVYFSVKPSVLSEKRMPSPEDAVEHAKNAIEKSGILLAEEEILRAMDAELSGKYAPVKSTSAGLKGMGGTVCLETVEEFGKLQSELESILCKIFEEMKSGNAGAEPVRIGYRNPCTWCEHRYICKRTLQA